MQDTLEINQNKRDICIKLRPKSQYSHFLRIFEYVVKKAPAVLEAIRVISVLKIPPFHPIMTEL